MSSLTRREFLRVAGVAGAGSILAACAPSAPTSAPEAPTTAPAVEPPSGPAEVSGKYTEAPALADLVGSGDLTSVEERLPENPLVVEPFESVGQYGGTMNMIAKVTPGYAVNYMQYEGLLRVAMGGVEILPNIAESWEEDEDAKVFTFNMRKGIKFYDGQPMTADDFAFWMEDWATDPDLSPGGIGWLKVKGNMPTFTKVDDYTFQYAYEDVNPFLFRQIASSGHIPFAPKHYLTQFHAKYVDLDDLAAQAKENEYDTWAKYFLFKADWQNNPECPMVFAWEFMSGDQNGNNYPRNPYYWKVDTEGNQLPYMDAIQTVVGQTVEVCQMMAFSGEADFTRWAIDQTPAATMILKKNEELGGYKTIQTPISEPNVGVLGLNLNHGDEVLRELFTDLRFRVACSLAINRDDVRDVVYLGQSLKNRQVAPLETSPFYHERAASVYVDYDPDQANALLDEMGLTERDSDGFRLRPDGETLTIVIEVLQRRPDYVDLAGLISQWWQDIGINATSKTLEDSLWRTKLKSGDMHATINFTGGGLFPSMTAHSYIPTTTNCTWAPFWGQWFVSNGAEGEEPPEDVKHQLDLFGQIQVEPDLDKRVELWTEIMEINADNLFQIGFCDRAPVPAIVSLKMHNVPETGWDCGWEGGLDVSTNPSQWWKEA